MGPSAFRTLYLVLASARLAVGQLNWYAKESGLLYFGTATDSPGRRERAGWERVYPQYDAILANNREFGQTTPVNGQKWQFTEPQRGVFNFTEGDIVSSLARRQDKVLRCHPLLWHAQLAPWVEAQDWTAAEMTSIVETHIRNVVGHWKGQCYAWDVVNEALQGDGSWRPTPFFKALGADFVKLAFQVASEVDPSAMLYYNEFGIEAPGVKANATLALVKSLKDAGIRIDGVGIQGHFIAGQSPSVQQQVEVMDAFGAAGVDVALTELDVRMNLPADETKLQAQKQSYQDAATACAMARPCVGITVWDFYDPFSWVPSVFAGEGAAHLWFENFTKHPAYEGVVMGLQNITNK